MWEIYLINLCVLKCIIKTKKWLLTSYMIPANTKGGRKQHLLKEECSSSDHASSNWKRQTKPKTNQLQQRKTNKIIKFFFCLWTPESSIECDRNPACFPFHFPVWWAGPNSLLGRTAVKDYSSLIELDAAYPEAVKRRRQADVTYISSKKLRDPRPCWYAYNFYFYIHLENFDTLAWINTWN